jgi:uncharacterized protein
MNRLKITRTFTNFSKLLNEKVPMSLSNYDIIGTTDSQNKIQSVTNTGFKINDKIINGPLIMLEKDIFKWNIPQYGVGGPLDVFPLSKESHDDPASPFHGWKPEMFSLFSKLDSRPELLLIGSGGSVALLPPKIRAYLTDLGIQVELLNSRSAGSTFNILTGEGRSVAVALIPLVPTDSKTGEILVEIHK